MNHGIVLCGKKEMAAMTQPKQKKIDVPLNPILLSEPVDKEAGCFTPSPSNFFPGLLFGCSDILQNFGFFFPCLYIGHFPLIGLEGVFSFFYSTFGYLLCCVPLIRCFLVFL